MFVAPSTCTFASIAMPETRWRASFDCERDAVRGQSYRLHVGCFGPCVCACVCARVFRSFVASRRHFYSTALASHVAQAGILRTSAFAQSTHEQATWPCYLVADPVMRLSS